MDIDEVKAFKGVLDEAFALPESPQGIARKQEITNEVDARVLAHIKAAAGLDTD